MPKVVLVGWPGADLGLLHTLLDAGEMPCLQQVLEHGVTGALSGVRPVVAPLVWSSVATGTRAYQHNVLGIRAVDERTGDVRPLTAATRGVPALWEILSKHSHRCAVVGWWGTHGSRDTDACVVSEAFGHPALAATATLVEGAITPPRLRTTLTELWVHPEEMDEAALSFFFPDEFDASQLPHPALTVIAEALAFTASRHAVFTWLVEHEQWDFGTVCLPLLESLAPALMTYLQARGERVSPPELELFRHVLAAGYKLLDQFLQRTLELCGKDVTVLVVSPYGYGFSHGAERTSLRGSGLLVVAGPSIRTDTLVHGANALDIAPTLLQVFELPVGRDMEGRVLAELFKDPPDIATVSSWRDQLPVSNDDSAEPNEPIYLDTVGRALQGHFAALGVVEPTDVVRRHAQRVREQTRWNLALSFLDGQQPSRALPLLEDLSYQEPENAVYALRLAACQLHLGMLDAARASIDLVLTLWPDSVAARMLMARLELQAGHAGPSLQQLQDVERLSQVGSVFLHDQLGLAYLRLRRWSEAIKQFQRALEIEPDDASAYLGIARAALGARRFGDAVDAALSSIGIAYQQPAAHYILGLALARQEKFEKALKSLAVAAAMAPNSVRAHYQLLQLKRSLGATEAELVEHRRAISTARDKIKTPAELSVAAGAREDRRREVTVERRRLAALERAESVQTESLDTQETRVPMNLVVVSGLPCSGCSVVVQMLAAGGLPILSDDPLGQTVTDWSPARLLSAKPQVLADAQGKAVKVLSPLVLALPLIHHYKILFVHRPIAEIVVSQQQVLARSGQSLQGLTPEEAGRLLARHRSAILTQLRVAPNVDLLELDYPALCRDPGPCIDQIVDFIGREQLPRAVAIREVVDESRHHVRVDSEMVPEALRFNLLFAA